MTMTQFERFQHRWLRHTHLMGVLALIACQTGTAQGPNNPPSAANAILFVTQVPIRNDFTTIGSAFGNHQSTMQSVGRGGDLWIRYANGTLKNLTRTAGFGTDGFQGKNAIAVRDPSVHWDGKKAIFSMVIGAPEKQYQYEDYFWQLVEITGLEPNDTPVITKVPNQPQDFNNIYPIYGSDDRIIFVSDRPRNGERHLHPQLDEYEGAPTPTGLWSLEPASGDLRLLNHAPSGDFSPMLDRFGRVVFTQWDHLQRDQLADLDKYNGGNYGAFNYASEAASAARLSDRSEIFPEPRVEVEVKGTPLNTHNFNHFFPWTINQDGTDGEVLNHLGRHELHGYIPSGRNDDPNLIEYYGQYARSNPNPILNMFQIEEDPKNPGVYYGIDAPEFYTHGSGQVVRLNASPERKAENVAVEYVTHRDTAGYTEEGKAPSPNHSGHYRDVLPMSDDSLVAAHTAETRGTSDKTYKANYDFRLKTLKAQGNVWVADKALTPGISKTISYWDPDKKVEYSGPLWELNPTEVRARPRPPMRNTPLETPEQQVFSQAGVNLADLKAYLTQNNLALAVVRNVTNRDDADKQQPYNLSVPGGVKTVGSGGKVYDVSFLQFFQADQVRGLGGTASPREGRRVIAQTLHDAKASQQNGASGGPAGSVKVASDGSAAAFVPARRAMTWQLTDAAGQGVVRERYWLTFQPGEVRVCSSCHGPSDRDQAGQLPPSNPPKALLELLTAWKTRMGR
jgi:hypothetical protein